MVFNRVLTDINNNCKQDNYYKLSSIKLLFAVSDNDCCLFRKQQSVDW